MNASRLRELIEILLSKEAEYGIQKRLSTVQSSLNALAAAPQAAPDQLGFSNALKDFAEYFGQMQSSLEPTQIEQIEEIRAAEFFASDIAGTISTMVGENAATLSVAGDELQTFVTERQQYIQQITELLKNLGALGVEVSDLEPGAAEIGFTIPREMFNGQLVKFIDQLSDINKIIRIFSEVTTGSVPDIELRQMSTSVPLIFFGLDPLTIGVIGTTFGWALSQWKKVEEIKEIRARTKSIPALADDLPERIDKRIDEMLDASTEEKVNEILAGKSGRFGRQPKEEKAFVRYAVASILTQVERGMRVEIRALPPVPGEVGEDGEDAGLPDEFKVLEGLKLDLSFPKVEGEPMRSLPTPPEGLDNSGSD